MLAKWLPLILLVILCLPITHALYKPGFYVTHDGEFNLVRLMHFDDELRNGQFPVRFASGLNYGFGSPIFTFFYPLTYYLASFIHIFGLDYGTSLKVLLFVATQGSIALMYLWLRGRYKAMASLTGALVYAYVPFRLLTLYVTGSFGVVLALFFVPAALFSIDRLADDKRFTCLLAVAVFGLLTSHNVTALILLPVILSYAVLTAKDVKRALVGCTIGVGMAAFFLLPGLFETKYVGLSRGVVVNFRDHFPTLRQLIYSPWAYFYSVAGPNDEMSFQVGIGQWLVAGLAGLVLVGRLIRRKLDKNDSPAVLFLLIFTAAIFLMLPWSQPIWEAIRVLPQIQFPWRILVATTVVTPFLAAYLVNGKFGKTIAIILIGLLIWNNRNYLRTWETIRYSDESYRTRKNLFNGSTDIAGETLPVWVSERPSWFGESVVAKNESISFEKASREGGKILISAEATEPTTLTVNQFYYPTFFGSIDGETVEIGPTDKTGLIRIQFPAGKHEVVISQGRTRLQVMADFITVISSGILVVFTFARVRKSSK